MSRQIPVLATVVILTIVGGTLVGVPGSAELPGSKLPRYLPVHTSSDKTQVHVGANRHVSKANEGIHHTESVIAAHPSDASRLFIAAMHGPGVAGYYSEDGGATWEPSFERKRDPDKDGRQQNVGDPSAAFGPDGSLYFVCIRFWHPYQRPYPKFGDPDVGQLEFIRSSDGGKTWKAPVGIPTYTDRPWLAVDGSGGKYHGRLYCFATIDKPVLHVSKDQGQTFAAPLTWPVKAGVMPRPVTPVVLTDGTLVLLCGLDLQNYALVPTNPKARVQLITLLSRDGGASLQEGTPVGTYWGDSGAFRFPQLAADTQSKKYRDRLYAVWNDGALLNRRRTQARIMFSSSHDKGRSWAEPRILSEQPMTPEGGKDYAAFLPSLAVNKDGILAVTWYDRRGLVDGPDRRSFPYGWNVRLRVSIDGGESWQPSVQVNERPAGKETPINELRESAGLAADASGNFHPVWIDDRTGKRQVWTATVKVEAK